MALLLGGFFNPVSTEAQEAARVARIGFLTAARAVIPYQSPYQSFLQGLRDHGYVEGRNVVIEYRSAEGKIERLPALAAELVGLKVDVIVAAVTVAALAAQQATRSVPIFFGAVSDPVATGLVASFARPGGNVTGLSFFTPELVGKSMELLKQAAPRVNRVAVLWQSAAFAEHPGTTLREAADGAARVLGVRLQVVEARGPGDFDRAFAEIAKARADALMVPTSATFTQARGRLDLAAKGRLPAVYPAREFVDAGGLVAYGPNVSDLFRRAASYVESLSALAVSTAHVFVWDDDVLRCASS